MNTSGLTFMHAFMIPWPDKKSNLLLIFTFYAISQVSSFRFHITWLTALNVIAIRVQRHTNVSKQDDVGLP